MKIGIVTFHRALNYGGVLQCYALYNNLTNLGHEISIIDYRPWYIERYRSFINWQEFKIQSGIASKFKYLMKRVLNRKGQKRACEVFDTFLSKMNLTTRVYSPNDIKSHYDLILLGSDQIWNPTICFGFDELYWGQVGDNAPIVASYAASIGETDKFNETTWLEIKKRLQFLNKVSVREKSFSEEIHKKCGIVSSWVLDPTLLSSKSFDDIIVKPKQNNYLFLFTVQAEKNSYSAAKRLADKLNCEIIHVSAIEYSVGKQKDESIKHLYSVSPGEFCGLIKYSKCVLTNSFHATAFSINFNKDFYVMKCPAQVRMNSLLKELHLEDRVVDAQIDFAFTHIDYSDANDRLNHLRESSFLYLNTLLQSDENTDFSS